MRVSTSFLEERTARPIISGEFEVGTMLQGPTGVVRLLEAWAGSTRGGRGGGGGGGGGEEVSELAGQRCCGCSE